MDATQILFNVALSVTTIFLIVIGIQLVFILNELKQSLKKINKIADNFEKIGGSFENSIGEIIGFIKGITSIFKIVDILHKKKNGKNQK